MSRRMANRPSRLSLTDALSLMSPPSSDERPAALDAGKTPVTPGVLFRGDGGSNPQTPRPRSRGVVPSRPSSPMAGKRRRRLSCRSALYVVLLALAVFAAFWWVWEPLELVLPTRMQPKRTLIMYNLLEANVAHGENLVYFINEGVQPQSGHTVLILLHSELRHQVNLPELPPGASYEFHDSPCSPWGAYAWVLRNLIGIEKYGHFVFVDSSARGPFVAPYVKGRRHWTNHLTDRLNDTIKLVGASISCESQQHWDAGGLLQQLENPHVQRYLFATDQEGMLLLMQAKPPLFSCDQQETDHPQLPEKIMSKVVLDHGFGLDCLMLRYQGANWRDKSNWWCNARLDPSLELQYDGTNLSPVEVMFAPAGEFQSSVGSHTYHRMAKYTQWRAELLNPTPCVTNNAWKMDPVPSKSVDMCVMERRGSRCFDHEYYARMNPELKPLSRIQQWNHFVQFGQFEGRQYRFACEMDWESLFNEVSNSEGALILSPPPTPEPPSGLALAGGVELTQFHRHPPPNRGTPPPPPLQELNADNTPNMAAQVG